jgi:hypothetical protein
MAQDNDAQSGSAQPDLIDDLVAEMQRGRRVQSTYRLVLDTDNWVLPPLADMLQVRRDDLNKSAAEILEFFEHGSRDGKASGEWEDFKWKITAFLEIQDIFDAPLYSTGSAVLNIFHLWYFYFESRYLLVESILCGLHGLYAASDALLRPFLEFSMLQLYYRNVCRASQSFQPLEQYFKSGINPSWGRAIKKALPENAFCRPIRSRLELHHKSLSNSATHPYQPDFSARHHSASPAQPSLEGIYFWHRIRLNLQPILWAYYVNFPMLFQPVDILKKFGFGGPVGVFADKQCATAVMRSLGEGEYTEFHRYAASDEAVMSRLSWFESLPDLTEEEIRETWDVSRHGELNRGLREGYAQHMAHNRALLEVMALKAPSGDTEITDVNELMRLLSYDRWKVAYKGFSK